MSGVNSFFSINTLRSTNKKTLSDQVISSLMAAGADPRLVNAGGEAPAHIVVQVFLGGVFAPLSKAPAHIVVQVFFAALFKVKRL